MNDHLLSKSILVDIHLSFVTLILVLQNAGHVEYDIDFG